VVARAALLDVNVLIALFDQNHVHHEIAHDWFADNRHRGWATCPITENGFVRIISNPTTGRNERPGALVSYLRGFCAGEGHEFWAASLSLGDQTIFALSFATHRLLTDVYLLGLAHVNGGTLATFDRTIPVKAVVGAPPDVLEVIGG
jgi:toxin-antitoxin system PIN domain toxin